MHGSTNSPKGAPLSALMYCPQCGLEHVAGSTLCPDCGGALTAEPPTTVPEPSAEWQELETVLETGDPTLIPVARSLLEAEGIPCFATGEGLQEFLGWGRIPSGINLLTGPVKLQVPPGRSEEARALLQSLEDPSAALPADEPVEE